MKKLENITGIYSLEIDADQNIQKIQNEFNSFFPFLRIEFIRDTIKKGSRDSKNLIITTNEKIGKIQSINKSGKISFRNDTTVNKLEEEFLKEFGLNVQVYRKSGSIWLVTTSTDEWTLKQQNDEGKSIANQLNPGSEGDY